MELRRIWALRGANIWAGFPVLQAEVALGDLSGRSSAEIPGFNDRLTRWLPGLAAHRCGLGQRNGFLQRLEHGTSLAHVLEHVTLELQRLAGTRVRFGRTRRTAVDGLYNVVVEYKIEELARAAIELGRDICLAAAHDRPIDVAAEVERLRALCGSLRLAPGVAAIVRAARKRRIPVLRFHRSRLVQLGHGAKSRRIHLEPSADSDTPAAGKAHVESIFPPPENGRIPIVSVTGVNGKTTTTRLIAHILGRQGTVVGMTCTDGLYVQGRRIQNRDCSGPRSARAVLMNPRVDVAVLETARGGILREGLGYDRATVAVVTNIAGGDHLGLRGITTLDELARVKTLVVRAVQRQGAVVLNASDPRVAAMAADSRAPVIYFSRQANHPAIIAHRRQGGRTVLVCEGAIVLAQGTEETRLAALTDVPLTQAGRVGFQVENALAAAASAWALGLPVEAVRAGLASFAGDTRQLPGRFNVLMTEPATVIVDFAHNAPALAALVAALDQFPPGRRTIVLSTFDRRDEDVIEAGRVLGSGFDRVLLVQDRASAERRAGELCGLIRAGLAGGSRVAEVCELPTERDAVLSALEVLKPGEMLVIGIEEVEAAPAWIASLLASSANPTDPHPATSRPANSTRSEPTP